MAFVYIVLDTCAGMNQVISNGITYIDVIKSSIETLIKYRIRNDQSSNKVHERYMLVYYNNESKTVCKNGFKESYDRLLSNLKLISCSGTCKLSISLKETFEFINVGRLSSGIESFCCGRKPSYIEPTSIICLTLPNKNFVINLESINSTVDGLNLYLEPTRWDQKISTIYLTPSSTDKAYQNAQYTCSLLKDLALMSGGYVSWCFNVNQLVSELNKAIDLARHPSVRINFHSNLDIFKNHNKKEKKNHFKVPDLVKIGALKGQNKPKDMLDRPSLIDQSTYLCLMYVSINSSNTNLNWPIPEVYNTRYIEDNIPPRSSIPNILLDLSKKAKITHKNLKGDIYRIENPDLLDKLNEISPNNADFDCSIIDANSPDTIHPSFGYVSVDTSRREMTITLLCWDFHTMNNFLDELLKIQNMKMTRELKCAFESFLGAIPSYYYRIIRNELKKLSISPNIFSEVFEHSLNPKIIGYINQIMASAKTKLEQYVISNRLSNKNVKSVSFEPLDPVNVPTEMSRVDIRDILLTQNIGVSFDYSEYFGMLKTILEAPAYNRSLKRRIINKSALNPFDLELKDLIKHFETGLNVLTKSTDDTIKNFIEEESTHQVLISTMGDYQSRMKTIDLDRIYDPSNIKPTTFGSPFKSRQPKEFTANEADIQQLNNIEKNKSSSFRIRMERRRKTFKIKSFDISSISSISLQGDQSITSDVDFTLGDTEEEANTVQINDNFQYYLHNCPFRNYLLKCYNELRQHRPNNQFSYSGTEAIKMVIKRCQKYPKLLNLILYKLKHEATLFNNFIYVKFIDKELNKIVHLI